MSVIEIHQIITCSNDPYEPDKASVFVGDVRVWTYDSAGDPDFGCYYGDESDDEHVRLEAIRSFGERLAELLKESK